MVDKDNIKDWIDIRDHYGKNFVRSCCLKDTQHCFDLALLLPAKMYSDVAAGRHN